jgi:hypothetical protein
MKYLTGFAIWICFLSTAVAQAPDPGQGREIALKQTTAGEFRLVQVPRASMVNVPIRYLIVAPAGGEEILSSLTTVQIKAAPGSIAERAYVPTQKSIFNWGSEMGEFRETYEMEGRYEIRVFAEGSTEPLFELTTMIEPVRYLGFMQEILLFTTGCLLLGAILYLIWRFLRKDEVMISARTLP